MLIISEKYGNLGNNLYQLLGIIYLSIRLNDKIDINKLKNSELNKIIKLDDLENSINTDKIKQKKIISHHFFKLYQIDSSFNPKREYFELGKKIIPFLKKELKPINKEYLLIHIRALQNHGYYVQTPLNYYIKVIKETNYKKYIIITEPNNNNPVIKHLKKIFPEIIIQINDYNNFYSLLECENQIFTRSTFSVTSIFLNPYLKNIYFIEDLINKDNYYDLLSISKEDCPENIIYNLYKLKEKYIIPGKWLNNIKDINKMLNFPIDKIDLMN